MFATCPFRVESLQRFFAKVGGGRAAILLVICLGLFFTGLGDRALWDIDEGWHAVTSKLMVQTGDWVRPEFNGEAFLDKPPLYNWLVAASFQLLGYTEFAARLPSALLGLATVLAVFGIGRSLVGNRAAFLGAIILAFSVAMIALSRAVVHDICFTFFVTFALLALGRAYVKPRRRLLFLLMAFVSAGLSILAKGPLGAVLIGGVFACFLILRRDHRFILQMMPIRGTLLTLAIGAPWYLAMAAAEPGYLQYFLLEQNLANFSSSTPRHPDPWHFYLPVLLVGLFPWSFHLPLAAVRLVRKPRHLDPARLFLITWAAFIFLFFSIASSKLASYLLPMWPAAALVLGLLWDRVLETTDRPVRHFLAASHLLQVVLIAWVLWSLWTDARSHRYYNPEMHEHHLVALSAILSIGLILLTLALLARRFSLYFGTNAALLGGVVLYLLVNVSPALDPYRSSREIGVQVDALMPPGEKFACYPVIRDSALFYTDREALVLTTPNELEDFLRNDARPCIVQARHLHELNELEGLYRVLLSMANKIVIQSAVVS